MLGSLHMGLASAHVGNLPFDSLFAFSSSSLHDPGHLPQESGHIGWMKPPMFGSLHIGAASAHVGNLPFDSLFAFSSSSAHAGLHSPHVFGQIGLTKPPMFGSLHIGFASAHVGNFPFDSLLACIVMAYVGMALSFGLFVGLHKERMRRDADRPVHDRRTCVRAGISTDMCVYLYTSLHSCLCRCLYTCLCTCLSTFLNTCLHKCQHTFSSSSSHFAAGVHSSHDSGQIAFTCFSDRPDVHRLAFRHVPRPSFAKPLLVRCEPQAWSVQAQGPPASSIEPWAPSPEPEAPEPGLTFHPKALGPGPGPRAAGPETQACRCRVQRRVFGGKWVLRNKIEPERRDWPLPASLKLLEGPDQTRPELQIRDAAARLIRATRPPGR